MDTQQFTVLQKKVNKAKLELNLWEKDFYKKHYRRAQPKDIKENNMDTKYKEYSKLKKALAEAKAELGMNGSQLSQGPELVHSSQASAPPQENTIESPQETTTVLSPTKDEVSSADTRDTNSTRTTLRELNTHSSSTTIPEASTGQQPVPHTTDKHSQTPSVASSKDSKKRDHSSSSSSSSSSSNDESQEDGSSTKKRRTLILNGFNKEKYEERQRRKPKFLKEMEERRRRIFQLGVNAVKRKEEREQPHQSSQQRLYGSQQHDSQQHDSQQYNTRPLISGRYTSQQKACASLRDFLDTEDSEDEEELGFTIVEDTRPVRPSNWHKKEYYEWSDAVKLKIKMGTLGEVCEFNKKLEEKMLAELQEEFRPFFESQGMHNFIDQLSGTAANSTAVPNKNSSTEKQPQPPVITYKKRGQKRQTKLLRLKFVE